MLRPDEQMEVDEDKERDFFLDRLEEQGLTLEEWMDQWLRDSTSLKSN